MVKEILQVARSIEGQDILEPKKFLPAYLWLLTFLKWEKAALGTCLLYLEELVAKDNCY